MIGKKCPVCDGTGIIADIQSPELETFDECSCCKGTGKFTGEIKTRKRPYYKKPRLTGKACA